MKTLLRFWIPAIGLLAGAFAIWYRFEIVRLNETNTRLQLVVDIWQNCPMPPKGYALVIESDWDGKKDGQDFRCFHARKRAPNLRPSSAQEYDGRCRRGLCV